MSEKAEKRMDIAIAFYNLKRYQQLDRLDEIPDCGEVGPKFFNVLTEANFPARQLLKETPMQDVSSNLRKLLTALPGYSLTDLKKWAPDRQKPLERGTNHVLSGHVLKHSLGFSSSGNLLVATSVMPSYKRDVIYTVLVEYAGKERVRHFCNCVGANVEGGCSHLFAHAVDIAQYQLRKMGSQSKFLAIRSQGQQSMLKVARYYPIHYVNREIFSSLGNAFIVSPVTLNQPLHQFKASRDQWNSEIKPKRKQNEKKVQCLCPSRDSTDLVKCKGCFRAYHRSCLIEKRKKVEGYYCDECSEKYLVTFRDPVNNFDKYSEILKRQGEEYRKKKKQQNQDALKARQSGGAMERRHDLKMGEVQTPTGIRRRPPTEAEKDAAQDLDAMDVDFDNNIVQTLNFADAQDSSSGEDSEESEGRR
jgi:hypothetical protein